MPRALLSVSDKEGIVAFARALQERGWTILSTGGTARALREAELRVTEVSEATGHPEMMEGRVKTLHPAIHAGVLARRSDPDDLHALENAGYEPIDLVAVNLYPFRETVRREGATVEEAIENIDIGGPAMLRAAAKNHESVWVAVDPADYDSVLRALDAPAHDAQNLRRRLAAKAFSLASSYDRTIADYLDGLGGTGAAAEGGESDSAGSDSLPPELTLRLVRVQDLRYGENPDQRAAFYAEHGAVRDAGLFRQLSGKELSFNNLLDLDAALLTCSAWDAAEQVACVIVKHATPCGVAVGEDAPTAYRKALATDPTSAFGSTVAFNTEVTEQAAVLLRPNFIELIAAPGFAPGALRLLQEKKNLRLLEIPTEGTFSGTLDVKRAYRGFLLQERLSMRFPEEGWRVATEREPSAAEWHDLRFAWRAVATVKSNAILLARDGMAVGIGAGQMSRVDSSRLAVSKAADNGFDLRGAVLASDAFFPFRDGIDAAASAGIRAVIQPGGSVRDEEVIRAANEHGIAMVFTGRRLFRH